MLTNAQTRNTLLAGILKYSVKNNTPLADEYNSLVSHIQRFATAYCPLRYHTEFYSLPEFKEIVYNGLFNNKPMPNKARYFIAQYVSGVDNINSQTLVFDDKQAGMTASQFKSVLKIAVDKHTKDISDFNAHMDGIADIVLKQPVGDDIVNMVNDMRTWCSLHSYEHNYAGIADIMLFMYGRIEGIRSERKRKRSR